MLFRLATGTEFKLREVPVAFDLVALELESEPLFGSTFFLTALVGTGNNTAKLKERFGGHKFPTK